jgi:hypothetical protein
MNLTAEIKRGPFVLEQGINLEREISDKTFHGLHSKAPPPPK